MPISLGGLRSIGSSAAMKPKKPEKSTAAAAENAADTLAAPPAAAEPATSPRKENALYSRILTSAQSFKGLLGGALLKAKSGGGAGAATNGSNAASASTSPVASSPASEVDTSGLMFGISLRDAILNGYVAENSLESAVDLDELLQQELLQLEATASAASMTEEDLSGRLDASPIIKLTIPLAVRRCIEFLNHKGLSEEGLYRISGNKRVYEGMRSVFNAGRDIDFLTQTQSKYVDPHDVGALLLDFFDQMPESIFGDSALHRKLTRDLPLDYFKDDALKARVLRAHIQQMTPWHYATFKCFMKHLVLVTNNSAVNQMTQKNILICVCGLSDTQQVYLACLRLFDSIFDESIESHARRYYAGEIPDLETLLAENVATTSSPAANDDDDHDHGLIVGEIESDGEDDDSAAEIVESPEFTYDDAQQEQLQMEQQEDVAADEAAIESTQQQYYGEYEEYDAQQDQEQQQEQQQLDGYGGDFEQSTEAYGEASQSAADYYDGFSSTAIDDSSETTNQQFDQSNDQETSQAQEQYSQYTVASQQAWELDGADPASGGDQ